MKYSNAIGLSLLLFSIAMTACSSSDGGGTAAAPTTDSLAEVSDTLSKAEDDIVSDGQAEQDAVDAETPQEIL